MPQSVHKLPPIPDVDGPGVWVARRSVRISIGALILVGVAGMIAAATVSIESSVEAMGSLAPSGLWGIRSREAGVVSEIYVSAGDTVQTGQTVAQMDPTPILRDRLALAQRQRAVSLEVDHIRALRRDAESRGPAAIQRARVQFDRAEANLREALIRSGISPDSLGRGHGGGRVDIDRARADVAAAAATISELEAEFSPSQAYQTEIALKVAQLDQLSDDLSVLDARLQRLEINSPTDGVVLTEGVHRLEGIAIAEGDLVMEVGELGAWSVILTVPESDLADVEIGARVRIEIQALSARSGRLLDGHVVSVSPAPIEAGVGAFLVRVDFAPDALDSGLPALRRGYTVRAFIIADASTMLESAMKWIHERRSRSAQTRQ